MELFLQLLAGLSVILFLVAVSMSYKTWRVHTILLVCCVFMASGLMFAMAVQVLKAKSSWYAEHERLKAKTLAVEKEIQEIREGVVNDEREVVEDGIEQLKQAIRHELYDRGRIWTDVKPVGVNGSTAQVRVEYPNPHQIKDGMVLYAFDKKKVHEGGKYLGEFRASVAGGGEPDDAAAGAPAVPAAPTGPVTLQAVWPMSQAEQARLQAAAGANSEWILSAKMPTDSHDLFSDTDTWSADELGLSAAEFASLNREDRLIKFFPPDQVPAEVFAEYVKDGQPAEDHDPPERIKVLVEFEENQPVGEEEYRKRTEVWLPKVSEGNTRGADDLAAAGIVEIIDDEEPRFARKLRDYAHLFHDIYLDGGEYLIKVDDQRFKTATVTLTVQEKQALIDGYEQEKAQLTEDKNGFTRDLNAIDKLLAEIMAQRNAAGRLMVQLRQQNAALAERLDRLQMSAVRAIDARAPAPQASAAAAPARAANGG